MLLVRRQQELGVAGAEGRGVAPFSLVGVDRVDGERDLQARFAGLVFERGVAVARVERGERVLQGAARLRGGFDQGAEVGGRLCGL